MFTRQEYLKISQMFLICLFLLSSNSSHARYYNNNHHYHGYSQYHHGYQHRYNRHYGVHANISDHAGYIILGILGVAFLSHIYSNNRYKNEPSYLPKKTPIVYKKNIPKKQKIYIYRDYEGWDWLAKGNAEHALDIFAVQSQQNLNSGIPKIGFAIAAASLDENQRAVLAMRKAIRIDSSALNRINTFNIDQEINNLAVSYELMITKDKYNADNAFMLATFSYLQEDFLAANNYISNNDHSQSAINLRKLINTSN